jgi:hypothetical protein
MAHPQKTESPPKTLPFRRSWESRFNSDGTCSSYWNSTLPRVGAPRSPSSPYGRGAASRSPPGLLPTDFGHHLDHVALAPHLSFWPRRECPPTGLRLRLRPLALLGRSLSLRRLRVLLGNLPLVDLWPLEATTRTITRARTRGCITLVAPAGSCGRSPGRHHLACAGHLRHRLAPVSQVGPLEYHTVRY